MGYGSLNYEVNVGASFRMDFTWLFPDDPNDVKSEFNTPQDLTGWSGQVTGPSLTGFPLTLTLGGTAGTIEGEILDTTTWAAGTYDYQVAMTAPDSDVDIILTGRICVSYVPFF